MGIAMKNLRIRSLAVITCLIGVFSLGCSSTEQPTPSPGGSKNHQPTQSAAPSIPTGNCMIDQQFTYDRSDWRVLSGSAAVVAVVSVKRVLNETADMSPGHVPETTFELQGLKQIKGELPDLSKAVQDGTTKCPILGEPLMQVGHSYIVALTFNPNNPKNEYGVMGNEELSGVDAQNLTDGRPVSSKTQALLDAIANPESPPPGR